MKMAPLIAAATLCGAAALPVHAADCQLASTLVLKMFATTPEMLFSEAAEPVVTRSYQPGQTFTVKTGELLLRRQVNPAAASASFAQDLRYGSSLPLSTEYQLKAGTRYTVLDVPRAPGLKALQLPERRKGVDEYLFLNSDGHLCERAMSYETKREYLSYRSGSYHAEPDLAATISAAAPDDTRGRTDAIVLASIDAAAFELVLRPQTDGTMGEAQKQAFDRRKTEIEFAGYKLKIDSVGSDAVTLSVQAEPEP